VGAPGEVEMVVWAPAARSVSARVASAEHSLSNEAGGFWAGRVPSRAGDDYLCVIDGGEACPDPCSRHQPHGVFGPSRILEPHAFGWSDGG
jgi:maltooligosyltrehalose trehalohydrolase